VSAIRKISGHATAPPGRIGRVLVALRAQAESSGDPGREHDAAATVDHDACRAAHALDVEAGVWIVRVTPQGAASLHLNGAVVSELPPRLGLALMNLEFCPFERAVGVVTALRGGFTGVMGRAARADLEFGLARWLLLHFDP